MRKFIYIVLAIVLAFSLGGFAAPAPSFFVSEAEATSVAPSPLVTEVKAAPADTTVTTNGVDTFNFSQTVLEASEIIFRWTEVSTTDQTCLLTSILIKEAGTSLVCEDVALYYGGGADPGAWSGAVPCWDTDVPLGYQV